jgi:hypothetical protein
VTYIKTENISDGLTLQERFSERTVKEANLFGTLVEIPSENGSEQPSRHDKVVVVFLEVKKVGPCALVGSKELVETRNLSVVTFEIRAPDMDRIRCQQYVLWRVRPVTVSRSLKHGHLFRP